MLVGWIIGNSETNISDGISDPRYYNGVEGLIPDLNGKIYHLKVKVYKVSKPLHSNVFVIEPEAFKKDLKDNNSKLKHSLHAIFIESNDGVKYKGWNSWGTTWPIIYIPMDNFSKDLKAQV